ncbi:hypothetical protein CIB95_12035 [Lottiidibacillus patelloidae]|uniref:DUF2269 domain-containing protein n=1 Tax=Lottiidibacillus patelloidae TaxID=2670334 RepID=A0A263BSF2_9BACI|nr:DUF2269 family protein [Lottiidibacillus patelloidae]OZM56498.1 hypothetical protein CIB95_12035 [Lottiidibacillus patelloidae]
MLLSIHILSAIAGIGATFLFPFILALPKKVSELTLALRLIQKGANYPKFGSILLLLTGLGMGALNTDLFLKGWYITAIVLLLAAVLIYVIKILPGIQNALNVVCEVKSEEIPETYWTIKKGLKPLMITASTIDVFIIILMIWKPL